MDKEWENETLCHTSFIHKSGKKKLHICVKQNRHMMCNVAANPTAIHNHPVIKHCICVCVEWRFTIFKEHVTDT